MLFFARLQRLKSLPDLFAGFAARLRKGWQSRPMRAGASGPVRFLQGRVPEHQTERADQCTM
jgi:hypothetical protein